jgi:hypothetical protein
MAVKQGSSVCPGLVRKRAKQLSQNDPLVGEYSLEHRPGVIMICIIYLLC